MENSEEMTFWHHLEALRRVLLRVAAALLLCLIGYFCAMPLLFDRFVLGPTDSDFFLYRWFSGLGDGEASFPISAATTSVWSSSTSTWRRSF